MTEINWMVILDFRVCACKVRQLLGEVIYILSRSGKRVSDRPDEIKLKRQKNNIYTNREKLVCYNT